MFEIVLKTPAKKFLKKLDLKYIKEIIKKIKTLKQNPNLGIPLGGNLTGLWKLRIGKYRAIYKIENNKLIIYILNIGHRKNIYN